MLHSYIGLFNFSSSLQSTCELVPEQGPGFYNKIMAGRPVALLAALVNIAMAVGKYFRRKKKGSFSNFEWSYVKGIILDFPGYWALSPSISLKGGLATWGSCEAVRFSKH